MFLILHQFVLGYCKKILFHLAFCVYKSSTCLYILPLMLVAILYDSYLIFYPPINKIRFNRQIMPIR